MARLHRRYKHRRPRRSSAGDPAPRRNPPILADLVQWVGPGFASFAATRFLTRVAATQIARRKPSWGKHAGAGASVAAFASAWWLGHRVKWIAQYHTPITVGAAIAAIQSLVQLYLPKLGWMLADATPELAAGASAADLTAPQTRLLPVNEDPNEFTYDDSFDAGRYSQPPAGRPQVNAAHSTDSDDDDLSDLVIDDAIGAQNLGVFSN